MLRSRWLRGSGRSSVTAAAVALLVLGGSFAIGFSERADRGGDTTQPGLELLGASGVLPATDSLDTVLLAALRNPERHPLVSNISAGQRDLPHVAMRAYQRAALVLAKRQPDCGLDWTLLAGLGQVISGHADGDLDPSGRTNGPILGLRLNGDPGVAMIRDSDGGQLDGDTTWDRATGPMQFIPTVWHRLGADSDGNGTGDPHNIYDASLTAGRYLCERGSDLRDAEGAAQAVFHYQRSESFVRAVIGWKHVYANGSTVSRPVAPAEMSILPPIDTVVLPNQAPPPPSRFPAGPERSPSSAIPQQPNGPDSTIPTTSNPPPASTPRPTGTSPPPSTSSPPPSTSSPPPSTSSPPPSTSSPPPSTTEPTTTGAPAPTTTRSGQGETSMTETEEESDPLESETPNSE